MRVHPVFLATTTTRLAGRVAVRSASVTGLTIAAGVLGVADGVSRARSALAGPRVDAADAARRSTHGATEF